MKTLARYIYPKEAETRPFDGALVSTLIKPHQVFINHFIGYDESEEVALGLLDLEEASRIFSRRVFTEPVTEPLGLEFLVQATDDENILISINTMGATEVYILANTTNDLGTATETDVTAELAPSGGTYQYNIGAPNATRYFWIRMRDASDNETIESLGAYTTQDNTPPTVNTFTLAPGSSSVTTEIDVTMAASDNDAVQSLYLLVSDTLTTPPSAAQIKTSGLALGGTTTSHKVSALTPGVTYYGWLLASDQVGNDSPVVASDPPTLTTAPDVTPPTLDENFTLTASSGAEETSVDITISISDVVG